MKWTIAFDSSCDLRDFAPLSSVDLELVPLTVLVGQKEFIDDGTTPLETLQQSLDEEKGKTGTACPSVGAWQQVMEAGENVIALTLSSAVSGCYQSACMARDMVLEEHPEKHICVVDSVSGSGGILFLLRRAVELIEQGASFEAVCQGMQECRSRCEIFFLLQNVDNLVSNGRLNALVGRAVKALKLCMLSTVSREGTMEVIAKVRNFGKTMDRTIEECLRRGCTGRKIIISHCLNLDGAQKLKEKLLSKFPQADIEIMRTGLICGYYAEKGGLIVALEN